MFLSSIYEDGIHRDADHNHMIDFRVAIVSATIAILLLWAVPVFEFTESYTVRKNEYF